MARKPKTEAPHSAEQPKTEASPTDSGLVRMGKGGESLDVHPSCVKDHERVGWRLA